MRKLIVLSFITMDGVMQAPGGLKKIPLAGSNMVARLLDTLMTFLAK
jgi:hypothetical protein